MITNKTPTNREKSYIRRMNKFMENCGPHFTLVKVSNDGTPQTCQCCGKSDIHVTYCVKNDKGDYFIVGSECQRHVLTITEAIVPAAVIRNELSARELFALGQKFGIKGVTKIQELADAIIKARRSQANKMGHISRKTEKQTQLALQNI